MPWSCSSLDAELVEGGPEAHLLLAGDPDGRVRAGPALLVHGDRGRAEVGHDRMALGLHDPRAEDALVEGRSRVRVG
jgi:hypothetical protein